MDSIPRTIYRYIQCNAFRIIKNKKHSKKGTEKQMPPAQKNAGQSRKVAKTVALGLVLARLLCSHVLFIA